MTEKTRKVEFDELIASIANSNRKPNTDQIHDVAGALTRGIVFASSVALTTAAARRTEGRVSKLLWTAVIFKLIVVGTLGAKKIAELEAAKIEKRVEARQR